MGIPPSPIQAPDVDLLGQLRVDDPNVPSPPGLGSNVFKDRGGLERADFLGPLAVLLNPVDNDSAAHDRNAAVNKVRAGRTTTEQLHDPIERRRTRRRRHHRRRLQVHDPAHRRRRDHDPGRGHRLHAGLRHHQQDRHAHPHPGCVDQRDLHDHAQQLDPADQGPGRQQPAAQRCRRGATQFIIELADTAVSSWQNPRNKFDVNDNGIVAGLDVLLIINRLLAGQTGPLPLVAGRAAVSRRLGQRLARAAGRAASDQLPERSSCQFAADGGGGGGGGTRGGARRGEPDHRPSGDFVRDGAGVGGHDDLDASASDSGASDDSAISFSLTVAQASAADSTWLPAASVVASSAHRRPAPRRSASRARPRPTTFGVGRLGSRPTTRAIARSDGLFEETDSTRLLTMRLSELIQGIQNPATTSCSSMPIDARLAASRETMRQTRAARGRQHNQRI